MPHSRSFLEYVYALFQVYTYMPYSINMHRTPPSSTTKMHSKVLSLACIICPTASAMHTNMPYVHCILHVTTSNAYPNFDSTR